jgi:hypothetical protein
VAELVGYLTGGQFAFVEQGGAGLAEDVAGDPGELAAAAGLTQFTRQIRGITPSAGRVREQRPGLPRGGGAAFEHAHGEQG